MTPHTDDVVKLASGSLVDVELWQATLTEAGISSRVVGTNLATGFGSALPTSIELWVHRGDVEKASAALRYAEEHRGEEPRSPVPHGIPESDRLPHAPTPERKRTHPTPY
jgi:hypothetical protein